MILVQNDEEVINLFKKYEYDKNELLKNASQNLSLEKKVKNQDCQVQGNLILLLEQATQELKDLGLEKVNSLILLMSLCTDISPKTKKILNKYEIDYKKIKNYLKQLKVSSEEKFELIKKYTNDLTLLANENKIDPVIGREEEIKRSVQILTRRTKNNPILIGDPGVGKTAIAEGISIKIIEKNIPQGLEEYRVVSLDLASLLAGSKFRGEFEEKLKNLLKEIEKHEKIILFIDEIHTVVGTGANEGSLDVANILKPMLARGKLHCIGATTLEEYRKYFEKDAALSRRFQTVFVSEPSIEDTISILRGIKS